MQKHYFYQDKETGRLKDTRTYTAEKNAIMQAASRNFLEELRTKLEATSQKFAKDNSLFDTEEKYLSFCRSQIRATALKLIAFDLELLSS